MAHAAPLHRLFVDTIVPAAYLLNSHHVTEPSNIGSVG